MVDALAFLCSRCGFLEDAEHFDATALAGAVAEVHAIGDCYQPRNIEVAVVDGHRAGRAIGAQALLENCVLVSIAKVFAGTPVNRRG